MINYLPAVLALCCFILAIILPFRFQPIPSFYAEALAFTALVFGYLHFYITYPKSSIKVPVIVLPILLISFIPLIQYFSGKIYFLESSFFPFLYILSLLAAIVLGFNLQSKQNLDNSQQNRLLKNLAFTLIIIGVISSVINLLQWSHTLTWLLFDEGSGNRLYGNLGQPNHMATILCMSLVACWYLGEIGILRNLSAYAILAILLWGLVLTQSRTTWIVLPFLLMFLSAYNNKNKFKFSLTPLWGTILSFFTLVLCLPYIHTILSALGYNTIITPSVVERATSGYLRFIIWDQMIHAIMQKPLLGWGWYQTAVAQYFQLIDTPGQEWVNSSHNIMLDILVWCGIPLGLCIIVYFIYIFFQLFNISSLPSLTALLFILPIAVHALLELPLFYAYFLIPLGIFIGIVLSHQKYTTVLIPKYISVFIVISGTGLIYSIFSDYNIAVDNQRKADTYEISMSKKPISLKENLFFDIQHERAKFTLLNPKTKLSDQQLNEMQKLISTGYTNYILYKYAVILLVNSKNGHADRQLQIINNRFNSKLDLAGVERDARKY